MKEALIFEEDADGVWLTVWGTTPEERRHSCHRERPLTSDEEKRLAEEKEFEKQRYARQGSFRVSWCYWSGPHPSYGRFKKSSKTCVENCAKWRLCKAIRDAKKRGEEAILLDPDNGQAIHYHPGMDDWEPVPHGLLLAWDERSEQHVGDP